MNMVFRSVFVCVAPSRMPSIRKGRHPTSGMAITHVSASRIEYRSGGVEEGEDAAPPGQVDGDVENGYAEAPPEELADSLPQGRTVAGADVFAGQRFGGVGESVGHIGE